MNSTLNLIFEIILSIGVLQALILGVMLVTLVRSNRTFTLLLALLLFLSSSLLGSELLDLFDLKNEFQWFSLFSMILDLAYGPLIWWLIAFAKPSDRRFGATDLLHLLPIILSVAWVLTGFQQFGINTSSFNSSIPDNVAGFVFYKFLVLAGYCVAFYRKSRFIHNLKPGMRLFLRTLVLAFSTIIFIGYSTFILMYIGIERTVDSDYISTSLLTCFIYLMTIMILRNPGLFFDKPLTSKYYKSGLDVNERDAIAQKLQTFITEQKPYLDETLTLNELASQLDLSPHILSQVINSAMNKSFNDLINEYRLLEVKKKLLNPDESHKKIIALAFESGFKSKATFNRIFKNSEGMTPVDFRRERGLIR